MNRDAWIALGTVGRPHGIRGEITLLVPARFETAFAALESVYWDDARTEAPIEAARFHKGHFLVRFAGVPDRNAAEEIRGTAVWARADDLREAGYEGAFVEELVGFAVETEDGGVIGEVADVLDYPAGEMLVVRDGSREHLIPYVPAMVLDVDREAGRLVVRPTPGLLDLNNE